MAGHAYRPFFDVEVWPNLTRRDDDVVITTYAKFGHLRMQHIVANILARAENIDVKDMDMPWVELRHPNPAEKGLAIEGQKSPRVLRTHLSAPYVYRETGKYIYVGRDPRELVWNLFLFHLSTPEAWRSHFSKYGFPQKNPGRAFDQYWERWFAQEGFPFWSYFDRLKLWWNLRTEDNILFLHYLDFKTDMEKVLRKLAEFLNISMSQDEWSELIKACSFQQVSNVSEQSWDPRSPFWNGAMQQSPEVSSKTSELSWRKYLTHAHEVELSRRLEQSIGVTGTRWIFSGRFSP